MYLQAVIVDDDSNNSLGVFNSEPEYFAEVRDLAVFKKLVAIKLLMEKSGMGLKDSKDWVDENYEYVSLEFIQNKRVYNRKYALLFYSPKNLSFSNRHLIFF